MPDLLLHSTSKKASRAVSCGILFAIAGLFVTAFAQGDSFDEDAFFSDTQTVVHDSTLRVAPLVSNISPEEKRVGFSGEIISAGLASVPVNYFDSSESKSVGISTFVVANLLLDVRLVNGVKAFANLETQYVPVGSRVMVGLRELFVDVNINHRAYLRTGKQVLQWGRCYFFNPTDLINVEKKLFIQKIGYREGAYGVKMHVPFGTRANLYGFLDTRDVTTAGGVAGAAKIELLAGGTELAVSLWNKRDMQPVFGFDMSTRVWKTDISAELSLSEGDNQRRLKIIGDSLLTMERPSRGLVPRAAIGLTRFWNVNGIPERLMMVGEIYYNHGGYRRNGFKDERVYTYAQPVIDTAVAPFPITAGPQSLYLFNNNLYDANNYSRYYAALFSNFSRFLTSEVSLQFNAIANLCQRSAVVSAGLTYASISDFNFNVLLLAYAGKTGTEYTLPGQRLAVRMTAGLVF